MKSEDAIILVRKNRPGSIQTQKQKEFVYEFERSYREALCVFPMETLYIATRNSTIAPITLRKNETVSPPKSAKSFPVLNSPIHDRNQDMEIGGNGENKGIDIYMHMYICKYICTYVGMFMYAIYKYIYICISLYI
jgi:hypothetical protein